jgi:hypothetical protein
VAGGLAGAVEDPDNMPGLAWALANLANDHRAMVAPPSVGLLDLTRDNDAAGTSGSIGGGGGASTSGAGASDIIKDDEPNAAAHECLYRARREDGQDDY